MNKRYVCFSSARVPPAQGVRWSVITTLACAVLCLSVTAGCAGNRATAARQPGLLYQAVGAGSHPVFHTVVAEAADAGLPPMDVTFDEAAASDFRLDLEFTVRDKGMHDTEAIWTATTIMLLTLYPSTCGHTEFALTGDLYDRGGRRLKSWREVEQDTAFLWLFNGKDCGAEPAEKTIHGAAAKLLKKVYADISRDGVLAGKPAAIEPLVLVETANASTVTERLLRTEAPFANFTFDAEAGRGAARVLRIWFEFVQSDENFGATFGRFSASIMTLGLVSGCPPNRIILHAEMLNESGQLLRAYEYAKKKRASMMDDCALATDENHPEIIAKLLRRLFRDLEKDDMV